MLGAERRKLKSLYALRMLLKQKSVDVPIVADEWCNTLDDIQAFTTAQAADFVQIKTPSLGSISNTIAAIQFAKQGQYLYLLRWNM
jgi:methylaspartate ammonia-lyase